MSAALAELSETIALIGAQASSFSDAFPKTTKYPRSSRPASKQINSTSAAVGC